MLGFSAGGHIVAAMSTHFEKRLYPAEDAADNESCRPDFAVALYPGHLTVRDRHFELNPAIRVSRETPPTFWEISCPFGSTSAVQKSRTS